MNLQARYTRRAYRFEQVLQPMPGRLLRDTPMRILRELALKIAREEAPQHAHKLQVVAGRGTMYGGGLTSFCQRKRIELARHHRRKLVLLHEMAHWLGHNDHGPRFMRTYIYLLCRYAGIERRYLNASWRKVGGKV